MIKEYLHDNGTPTPFNPWKYQNVEWRTDWIGFHFGAANATAGSIRRVEFWIVPYWSIVIPLTLLSAYLLLSKPHKSTPKKITEPIANEGP